MIHDMSTEQAVDLWRARFGYAWTTAEETTAVCDDPLWRKILFTLIVSGDVKSTSPAPIGKAVFALKDSSDGRASS